MICARCHAKVLRACQSTTETAACMNLYRHNAQMVALRPSRKAHFKMARRLAFMLGGGNAQEEQRLFEHHLARTEEQVRESLARQLAIAGVTQAEINLHCQFDGLFGDKS